MPQEKLRIVPLGGLGEIGMNCLVLEWKNDIVLVDCGLQFPDASYAGVDLLLPDLTYLKSRLKKIRGVVVTHGHDDHIGAIPFLARECDLDVYCTAFPEGLIRNKLVEFNDVHEVRFHPIKPRKTFSVGVFKFDPLPVAHSIIESVAFAIETPVGNLIHTGDFKHDADESKEAPLGFEAFEEWSRKGVLVLFSDSTNAERNGHTLSERDIAQSFEGIFSRQTGRLVIALFASNIRRIERLLGLAKKLHKKVALAGRSMLAYTKLAHEQSSLDIPEDTLILLENIHQYPDKDIIILATGSQAEPQSALVRVAQNIHKDIRIRSGDLVILSSRFIPGNERAITTMIDHLYRAGAEVLYESIHQIHVSGHGFQDELMMMMRAVRPKFFVPIHGEYRHLKKHASLALQAGVSPAHINVIEDGQMLEVSPEGVVLGEKLELQKVAIVEGEILDGNPQAFSQRANLAKTGIVFAVILREADSYRLIAEPQVSFHGLLFRQGESPEAAQKEAIQTIEEVHAEFAAKGDLTEHLRLELRRFFKKRVSHKPVVIPMILEI
jgi:ribonuclease J